MKPGVNIFGYVYAESGVGQLTRLLIETVRSAGLRYSVIPFTATMSRQRTRFVDLGDENQNFDINIVGVNADQIPVFVEHFGRKYLKGRYTIGIWAWEIEEFPDWMAESAEYLDEIWAISSFTADAISKKVDITVCPFPLPIRKPETSTLSRFELALPESFLFLYCFDLDSVFERKNPLGVVRAYTKAFPEVAGAHLFIKSINGDRHQDHVDAVAAAVADRVDITYRDGYSTAENQASLMKSCDAYISLHRAEGFGLTMAEAMTLGKPVIATGYSGNLDFMDSANSYLVPFSYTSIGPGNRPYPAGGRWAEPDIDEAARMIRRVFENPNEARNKAIRAQRDVDELHSPHARSEFVLKRIMLASHQLREKPSRRGARLKVGAGNG